MDSAASTQNDAYAQFSRGSEGMWGKRSNAHAPTGLWGKRAAVPNGLWGKRGMVPNGLWGDANVVHKDSSEASSLEVENDEVKESPPGLWGKRDSAQADKMVPDAALMWMRHFRHGKGKD